MDSASKKKAIASLVQEYLSPENTKLVQSDFPANLWIENTNCCNAACVMCPREAQTRKLGFMDFGLFEKIIHEAALFKNQIQKLKIHNYGEPLLDPLLPDRIRLAKSLGLAGTNFISNGALLTPEISRQIIESGLDLMRISFHGTDETTYNQTMVGLDFNSTLTNIKNFIRLRRDMQSRTPKIIMVYLPQASNLSQTEKFKSLFEPLIDPLLGDSLDFFALHNFGGGRPYHHLSGDIVSVCHFPWTTMVILHDGRVVTCCNDFDGIQVLGDVKKESLQSLWNGKVYSQLRKDFMNLNYKKNPVCLKCDWPVRLV